MIRTSSLSPILVAVGLLFASPALASPVFASSAIALPGGSVEGAPAGSPSAPLSAPLGGATGTMPPIAIAADCTRAAALAARQNGGRVLAARPDGKGGCEVTLLVPNRGQRPSRVVVTVPA